MKPKPFWGLNHFTVPIVIVSFSMSQVVPPGGIARWIGDRWGFGMQVRRSLERRQRAEDPQRVDRPTDRRLAARLQGFSRHALNRRRARGRNPPRPGMAAHALSPRGPGQG